MIDLLSYGFMQRALVAAVIVGVLCSVVAFFVVLKKLSFVGVGVSHSALGGVALGVITGVDPVITGGIFATAVAWLIGWVSRKGHISEDHHDRHVLFRFDGLGCRPLGACQVVHRRFDELSFWQHLGDHGNGLVALGRVDRRCAAVRRHFFQRVAHDDFDEELARADGLPVGPLYFGLLTVSCSHRRRHGESCGVVLGSALLVIPAAVGFELVKDYRKMLWISVATGVIGSVAGLVVSFYLDVRVGSDDRPHLVGHFSLCLCRLAAQGVGSAVGCRPPSPAGRLTKSQLERRQAPGPVWTGA